MVVVVVSVVELRMIGTSTYFLSKSKVKISKKYSLDEVELVDCFRRFLPKL